METDVSPGKKSRPVMWIALTVLALVVAVGAWQAKSLLPQPAPVASPMPVVAKVPPQPPPVTNQAVDHTNAPPIAAQDTSPRDADSDTSPMEKMNGNTDPTDDLAQRVDKESAVSSTLPDTTALEPDQGETIEDSPTTTPAPIPSAQAQQSVPPIKKADAQTQQTESLVDKSPQAEPAALASQPRESAPFTIQVGAFRTKTYANDKIADLTRRGYEPYIFEVKSGNKRIWYTVRFGHFDIRDEAAQALSEFKKKEGLDGMISKTDAL